MTSILLLLLKAAVVSGLGLWLAADLPYRDERLGDCGGADDEYG